MSRVIKFRGWHETKKIMFGADQMGKDQLTISPDGRGFINVSGRNTADSVFLPYIIPMQFIGQVDKNEKEIYEDDIVQAQIENPVGEDFIGTAVVEFDDECSCFQLNFLELGQTFAPIIGNMVEIVGNYHEDRYLFKDL